MTSVKLRSVPGTDLRVSPICLGTMNFGNPVAKPDAIALVHWALDHGINFIDTADIYEGYDRKLGTAGGVAEQILGEALVGRRDQAVIATKAGNPVSGPDSQADIGRAHLERQLNRSLKFLGTDYVDFFELHRPDGRTPLQESVTAMADFVRAGKVRHWGFSNFGADDIRQMVDLCRQHGYPRPVVSQPHYSWLQRDPEKDHLPACRELQISVTPYRVLEGGLLTGKYRHGQAPPAGSRMAEGVWLSSPDDTKFAQLEQFSREAEAAKLTPMQYAIQWVLNQPAIISCVVGIKRPEQLLDILSLG